MEIIKYQNNEILPHIRHNLRELPNEKISGNKAINPDLTKNNYCLVHRGNNAAEVNKYRKDLEKEIFHYKRKNLVHAIEVVIQCPDDCPPEQHEAFFHESYRYICSGLPMGEQCVFFAGVHRDERYYTPDGTMISKDHLHIMYVPAVPNKKHEGYEYRLCADQLTKKAQLKALHPGLQKHLDDCGIHATVYRKKDASGKTIPLSVKQLKELTRKTGIKLDHSLSIDEFCEIISTNILQENQIKDFQHQLQKALQENQRMKEKLKEIQTTYASKEKELISAKTTISNLKKQIETTYHNGWGNNSEWGAQAGWETNKNKSKSLEWKGEKEW